MQLRNRDLDRSPPRSRNSHRDSVSSQSDSTINPLHGRPTSSDILTDPELSVRPIAPAQRNNDRDTLTAKEQQNSHAIQDGSRGIMDDHSLADWSRYFAASYKCQDPDPNIPGFITPFPPLTRALTSDDIKRLRSIFNERRKEAEQHKKDGMARWLNSQAEPSASHSQGQMQDVQFQSPSLSSQDHLHLFSSHQKLIPPYSPDTNEGPTKVTYDAPAPWPKADGISQEKKSSFDVKLEALIAQGIAKYIASQPIYLKWNIRAAINTYFEQHPIKDSVEQAVNTYMSAVIDKDCPQSTWKESDAAQTIQPEPKSSHEASRFRRTRCLPPFPNAADYGVFEPVKCKPTSHSNTAWTAPSDARSFLADTNLKENPIASQPFARPRNETISDADIPPKQQKKPTPAAAWPKHIISGNRSVNRYKTAGSGISKPRKAHGHGLKFGNLFQPYDDNNADANSRHHTNLFPTTTPNDPRPRSSFLPTKPPTSGSSLSSLRSQIYTFLTQRLAQADHALLEKHHQIRSQVENGTLDPHSASEQITQARRTTRAEKDRLRLEAERRVLDLEREERDSLLLVIKQEQEEEDEGGMDLDDGLDLYGGEEDEDDDGGGLII